MINQNYPVCPKCGSKDVATERRPDGDHHCMKCKHVWPNKRHA